MKVGYARASSSHQKLDYQIDTLLNSGCEKIFTDVKSGLLNQEKRDGLFRCLEFLRNGDTLYVCYLDRLSRDSEDIEYIINDFKKRNINLISIGEKFDTQIKEDAYKIDYIVNFITREANLRQIRIRQGMEAAKERGNNPGRPTIVDENKLNRLENMITDGCTAKQICKYLKISRATFFREKKKLVAREIEKSELNNPYSDNLMDKVCGDDNNNTR